MHLILAICSLPCNSLHKLLHSILYPLAPGAYIYYLCRSKISPTVNLYIFNPENDLALAFGGINYTPPPAAQRIARELALLPLWYAREGEETTICSAEPVPDDFRRSLEPLGLAVSTVAFKQIGELPFDRIEVWGWNLALAHRLHQAGVDNRLLPSPEQCNHLRRLAHRRLATEAGRYLASHIDYPMPPLPVELHTPDEVRAFTEQSDRKVLKAPWSGSGRGLYWNLYGYDTSLAQWSNGVLQKQGVLMGEPFYEKERDWAMEFYSDGTRVTFAGYSSFLTDNHGAYKENRLTTDHRLHKELSAAVGTHVVTAVREALASFFTERIAPVYTGYLGVDMMTYLAPDGTTRLHPFVEINLRMNMGVVARRIADRFVAPGYEGHYRIDYFPRPGTLYRDHLERLHQHPARIVDGRFAGGYFALTPVLPDSQYRACIEFDAR